MSKPLLTAAACAALLAACVPTREAPPVVQPQASAAKMIIRDGGSLVLPDGTRVVTDAAGGFSLPNGDYVQRHRSGALILPTGARCAPTPSGYRCP